jgi:hypothetical protein
MSALEFIGWCLVLFAAFVRQRHHAFLWLCERIEKAIEILEGDVNG